MNDPVLDDVLAREERVRELEAENARLAGPAPAASGPAGSRWRAVLSAVCIVLASIFVPVSIVGAWAQVQLVDEDSFVNTLAPLVDDLAVQDLVIEETMGAITAQIDFARLTDDVFDGINQLGLSPRAAAALNLLRQPAAQGLENLVSQTVTDLVRSDAFSGVWATTVRGAHRALTVASTSDGGGVVVMTKDGLGIQLGTIVAQVKQDLVDRGIGVASLIPAVDRVVIIGSGAALSIVRTSYAIATIAGWWLPVVTLALFALGIAIARRRSVAVLGTGLGLAIGAASLAAGLGAGAAAVGGAAGRLDLSATALDVIYQRIVADMTQTAWVMVLLGVIVAIAGWSMGRSTAARRTRAATEAVNSSARRAIAAWGVDTGGLGRWLARNRVLVRVVIAAVGVLWLFALRPLSAGDVALVLVVALLVGWAFELLQAQDATASAADPTESPTAPPRKR
ncbi:hypothetical protein [Microbacterium sp.]|uniref:hypothetical protein n=1 Tax=Microbacterium sp. TaxID=51671 RepID=UPI0039E6F390